MLDLVERPSKIDNTSLAGDIVFEPSKPPHVAGFRDIIDLVRRHAIFILGFVLVCMTLLAVAVSSMRSTYTATSALVLERNDTRMLEAVTQLEGEERDRSAIETEMDILTSRVFAGRVVDAMNLVEHPWFNPYLPDPAENGSVFTAIRNMLGSDPAPDHPQLPTASVQRDASVTSLLSAIKVTRAGDSFAVSAHVQSPEPELSAAIANTIANIYVEWSRDSKLKAMSEAVNFLRERATQIAQRIAENEGEITTFSRLHDLASDPRDDTLRQRIDQTNSQLTVARVELAGIAAQRELGLQVLDRQLNVEGTPLDSVLLSSLRGDRARAVRETAQRASNLGRNHPDVVNGESEVSSIDTMIETEIRRVVNELGGKQHVTEQRVSRLQAQLTELQEDVRKRARAEIRLRELERDLLADQKLHDLVVARLGSLDPYTEIAKPSARVVSAAAVPTTPSFPQTRRIFAGGVVGSVVLAIVLALILEATDIRVRSGQHLSRLAQLPHLADIPAFANGRSLVGRLAAALRIIYSDWRRPSLRDGRDGPATAERPRSLIEELVERPRSAYAEAMRSLYLACRSRVSAAKPIVLFAAPGPSDDSASVALGFGISAARDGVRTIIVDIDPWRSDFAATRDPRCDRCIEDVVNGTCRLSEAVKPVAEIPGLFVIASRSEADETKAPIRSDSMNRLIEALRASYDMIVIDSAPVLLAETASWLSPFVDAAILVTKFGKTTEPQLMSAVARLRINRAPLIGTVLNGAGGYKQASWDAISVRMRHRLGLSAWTSKEWR